MPVIHHAHHPSEFQDLKTAMLACQLVLYATRLLSLSACFTGNEGKNILLRCRGYVQYKIQ